jgi:uncharacterized membrane protein
MFKFLEDSKRSIVKTISFRVLAIMADIVVIYTITKRYDLTFGVIVFSNLSSTLLYFLHERIWNRISWGRKHYRM